VRDASPLRYPGGKWRLAPFFERLIELNGLTGRRYIEPYAGGGSLALSLLIRGRVSEIHLNDLDPAIYAFWSAVVNKNRAFCDLIRTVRVTPDEWEQQKRIYASGRPAGTLALGFATFFLNRTNHSGILNGGMIGGKQQKGDWKLDARFNRSELVRRVRLIGQLKRRISISRIDGVELIDDARSERNSLVYLDPPYYRAGAQLYLNAYNPEDHASVYEAVNRLKGPWVVSYDDVPEISKLYRGARSLRFELLHTARSLKRGKEVLFFSRGLKVPKKRQS
jgi:DNA adenine methylase